MYRLRGHHLFCLLGFRGMGYSDQYVKVMKELYYTLNSNPETAVCIISGPDDLCNNYPTDKPCHCEEQVVYNRDANMLDHLGLRLDEQYTWKEILSLIGKVAVPADIPRFCSTCPWLHFGYCEDGVERVTQKRSLPVVR